MVDYPETSRLAWVERDLAKVPLLIAASGPKVMRLAARYCRRGGAAVGAEPTRIAQVIDTIREERVRAGRDMSDFTVCAYLSVVPDEDRSLARSLASGNVASFARFSACTGR